MRCTILSIEDLQWNCGHHTIRELETANSVQVTSMEAIEELPAVKPASSKRSPNTDAKEVPHHRQPQTKAHSHKANGRY